MKTLYLLRHAKAEPGGKDVADKDRVLSARGLEACAMVGAYMKTRKYVPELTLSSPSARTRQTLETIEKAMDSPLKQRFENSLYLATAEEILHALHGVEDSAASAMVVGHNPGMHHIALLLAGADNSRLRTVLELKYPTCALAVLKFDTAKWEKVLPATGALADFVTPEEL